MSKEIRLTHPHPKLRPRVAEDLRRPAHPGTAVRIGEDLYEVVAAERSGGEWIYRLEPWTGQDTIRVYVEWGEGSEREFADALHKDRIRGQKSFLSWAGQAFLGFLPARRQERRCEEAGLDPARATLWSAVLEIMIALPFAFSFFAQTVSGTAAGSARSVPAWAGLLACLVLAEGAFRLAAALSTGEPMGSLFLVLLDLRSKREGPEHDAGDEVQKSEAELKVLSTVPKVWWERAGGVTCGGESYVLTGSGRENKKYAYRFLKGGQGFPVLDPELEKARNRSSDLSYAFAPIWGFLPARRQAVLASYGRYKPRPNVVISAVVTVLVALALAGPGLKAMAQGVLETWSLVKLGIAAALFTESGLRISRLLKDGQASGSVLGVLIKPIYDLAIKDGRIPPAWTSGPRIAPRKHPLGGIPSPLTERKLVTAFQTW